MSTASADAGPLAQPRVFDAWYVACQSSELGRAPVGRVILDVPLVLFRDGTGAAACLIDRCPHRNVPLTMGKVVDGTLQCAYHGWRFANDGRCAHLPGLDGPPDIPSRCATSYPVREQQGFIWVWLNPAQPPTVEPFSFRLADDPGYMTVRREVRAAASLHMVVENALDVPHTAFLHGGLFRNDGDRQAIDCVVKRWHDRVECEYVGEARPEGLVGRILSPSGGIVTHFDRFYLPSVLEVEYRIGDENHILINGACTPVSDYDTRLYACVSARTRLPGWLLKPIVLPLALRIFGQDAVVLAQQTATLRRFGKPHFVSTDLDLLGPHVLRLLKRATRSDAAEPDAPVPGSEPPSHGAPEVERTTRMYV